MRDHDVHRYRHHAPTASGAVSLGRLKLKRQDTEAQHRSAATAPTRITSVGTEANARLAQTTLPPVVRIERIMPRALHVPQRTANDGRGRAVTVTRDAEQTQQWRTFGLVTGPQVAS